MPTRIDRQNRDIVAYGVGTLAELGVIEHRAMRGRTPETGYQADKLVIGLLREAGFIDIAVRFAQIKGISLQDGHTRIGAHDTRDNIQTP